jgi:predicted nucleic-acid-binding protein
MGAADTNLIVRIVARDNEHQVHAADAFIENGAWVSHLVLAEAMWVLATSYGLDASTLAETIEMLINHRDLVLQDSETVVAALGLFKARPSLGFSDCLILEVARKAGHLPLGTFDRALARVEGAHRL